ncbi:MAG TPA: TonB-dependent receptor [Sideroxyarcus sp.]|nr:TonB-dependent receptor [Sideroxyarcus sp.]
MNGCQVKSCGFALGLLGIALSQPVCAADEAVALDDVVVTGTREAQKKSELAATVGKVSGEALRAAKASHPSQVMGRIPGVWVNITGGEGHQTAIRQPLTTNAVYAYLEDGIPVRSTGFFNHNALYEVNMPQSGGIEVTKGPGSALYGSDAIGGVVNVLSRRPPTAAEVEASGELGSFGWKRLLVSGGNSFDDNGVRADLNLTKSDGWRKATGYDRQSGTLRWDRVVDETAVLKVLATVSNIDQQTAGSSAISLADYTGDPTINYTPISFRKVQAKRLSVAYDKETEDTLLSITPYFRDDSMDLLANWSLGYDPTVYNTSNQSFGMLAKYRMDFAPYRSRLIVGVDVDHSPGSRSEDSILTSKVGQVYTGYTVTNRIYDYKVTYQGVSPYVHGELSPTAALRLTGGLRYDDMSYDFRNNRAATAVSAVTAVGTKWYGQSADTSRRYNHLSPKLGATYAFSDSLNGFLSYNHSFRAPSEGQLFRPSAAASAVLAQQIAAGNLELKPVKVDSYETGLRGTAPFGVSFEASLYRMVKRDDILTQKDPLTNAPLSVNGGKTLHRGIELGLAAPLGAALKLDVAYSYAKHSYDSWVTNTADFTGKEMALAPRTIANARLSYTPALLHGGNLSAEVVTLGSYWMDDANTARYSGHDLLNLAASYHFAGELALFAKINNLADRRFAESTSGTSSYAPGMPRTFYLGIQDAWK